MTTLEENVHLEAGKAAQEVLKHPAFIEAFQATKNTCVAGILNSPVEAQKQRDDLYMLSRAVDTFVQYLADKVKLAKDIQDTLELPPQPEEHDKLEPIEE